LEAGQVWQVIARNVPAGASIPVGRKADIFCAFVQVAS
jgi:hypothetical protein